MHKVRMFLLLAILLTACAPPAMETPAPTPSPPLPSPTATDWPLAATVPRTPTPDPNLLNLDIPDPATVALDFVADRCDAQWSSNSVYLDCPGDPADTAGGYVGLYEDRTILGGSTTDLPTLLTIPAHVGGTGIFGRYPPFNVQYGDEFRAFLTCVAGSECDVTFHLEYFDAQGGYHEMRQSFGFESLNSISGLREPGIPIQFNLDSLAGLTVEFTLAVREEGELDGDQALWVAPHIYRNPDYTPPTLAPTTSSPSASPTEEGVPGVISGFVDMGDAPPYLNDPHVYGGLGKPVTVMFFNVDDGSWWWIQTTPTHPYYQMTVPPGRYYVVAYGSGVGDIPYVTGAYTGSHPSCGQAVAVVEVGSNEHVENIVVDDWNWSCGGTAFRPAKPPEVPVP